MNCAVNTPAASATGRHDLTLAASAAINTVDLPAWAREFAVDSFFGEVFVMKRSTRLKVTLATAASVGFAALGLSLNAANAQQSTSPGLPPIAPYSPHFVFPADGLRADPSLVPSTSTTLALPGPGGPPARPGAGTVTSGSAQNGASAASTAYPTNARGETYGSAMNAQTESQLPSLIKVQVTGGVVGYIERSDFEGPSLNLEQVRSLPRDSKGNFVQPGRVVPVFAQDGVTRIGSFTVTPGETGQVTSPPVTSGAK